MKTMDTDPGRFDRWATLAFGAVCVGVMLAALVLDLLGVAK